MKNLFLTKNHSFLEFFKKHILTLRNTGLQKEKLCYEVCILKTRVKVKVHTLCPPVQVSGKADLAYPYSDACFEKVKKGKSLKLSDITGNFQY